VSEGQGLLKAAGRAGVLQRQLLRPGAAALG
jgi:hypothetical protein